MITDVTTRLSHELLLIMLIQGNLIKESSFSFYRLRVFRLYHQDIKKIREIPAFELTGDISLFFVVDSNQIFIRSETIKFLPGDTIPEE